MRIIDAHQHCWDLARPECAWPGRELAPIYRDFSPDDWRAQATAHGVTGALLVQSQPSDADTDYLLRLAAGHDWILGVVGWVDLSADGVLARIAELASQPRLCGLRPMLQNLAADDWILQPALAGALAAMSDFQLRFDALVYSRHLPSIHSLARRYPGLRIVLDHAAKPDIAGGEWQRWVDAVARLAECPNVCCKLSGLLTEMDVGQGDTALVPYVEYIFQVFGAQRILWGSDWPVVNLAADYGHWLSLSRRLVREQAPESQQAVFCTNALRFYGLEPQ